MVEMLNNTAVASIHSFVDSLKQKGVSDEIASEVMSRLFAERNSAADETTRLFSKEKLRGFRFLDALDEHKRRAFGVVAATIGAESFSGGLIADGVGQLVNDLADEALRLEQLYSALSLYKKVTEAPQVG